MNCYCCSKTPYSKCCGPYLHDNLLPDTAEKLMRSRFSAYCTGNYAYIIDTYTNAHQQKMSVDDIAQSAVGTKWFALSVMPQQDPNTVEFKAWYFDNKKTGLMHETSHFVIEAGRWKYADGEMHADTGYQKIGRNDPCPCGSGKKFKQCCQRLAG